jgi:hypothetical protein
LQQNIREEVATIPPTMLHRVTQNFHKRLRECVDNGRPPHRHHIHEANIAIKMLRDKFNVSNKLT